MIIALTMEASYTFETSVSFVQYYTAQRSRRQPFLGLISIIYSHDK
jgi:hypothetical protein